MPGDAPGSQIDVDKSRNAAKHLVTVLTHRLSGGGDEPSGVERTTFNWGGGTVNFRNLIDPQETFWTNISLDYAERIHNEYAGSDFVYAMCHWNPNEDRAHLWLVPEGVLHGALPRLPEKASPEKKDIKIRRSDNHIFQDPQAVDLSGWHRVIQFSDQEYRALKEAYDADLAARARGKNRSDGDDASDDTSDDKASVDVKTFLDLMRRYRDRGTTFRTAVRGAWYAIGKVDDSGCEVDRLTANDVAQLTAKYFEMHIGRLRATHGRCPIADLANSGAIGRVLDDLLRWAGPKDGIDEPDAYVQQWDQAGRPPAMVDVRFPRCAARLCLMRERLREGYTSFWL